MVRTNRTGHFKRIFRSFSLAVAFGLAVTLAPGKWVLAQNTQTEGEAAREQTEQQQQSENNSENDDDRTETEQSTDAGDDAESGQQNTLGGFVPSEQISEDLSVSFPVDI